MILKSILIPSLVAAMQAVSAQEYNDQWDCSTYELEGTPTTFSTSTSAASSPTASSPTVAWLATSSSTGSNSPPQSPRGYHGIPANVQAFYEKVRAAGSCPIINNLKFPFFGGSVGDKKDFCYCDKFMENKGFYIKGPGSDLAPMQVDCDGNQKGLTPRCGHSKDIQPQTAFQSHAQAFGIPDLRADIHPYVVLGNEGSAPGFTTFDPRSYNVEPLSVVAVVCNGKLIFGIWGDINGVDGPPLVGEGSIALATACFGDSISGSNGHDQND